MGDIKKERLVIVISTLAALSCIVQNHFGGWEFWVPGVISLFLVILWWVNLAEKLDHDTRLILYFSYDIFLLFYYGIHDTSLFDISISVVLFMTTFTILDRAYMLNLILVEYIIIMAVQFRFLYSNGAVMSSFDSMRLVYHIGTVLVMYLFSRITVMNRISEHDSIQKWQESVKKNNEDIEDFLSNVSHELRTPVNVIGGMTVLMQKNIDHAGFDSIQDSVIRLSEQIEDIQDYTELKRGEMIIENENYMCGSLINDVVAAYCVKNKNTDLDFVVELSPDTPSLLNGDIKRIRKIFRHLLSNAVKFTKRGNIHVRVFAVPKEYGVNLTIEVIDTGIGMKRSDIAHVSKGMYQANKKRNRSTGGIGIGLPIVYGFAHKMGGFVMINSEKGKGTTVRVSIPQQVVDQTPCGFINRNAGVESSVIRIQKGMHDIYTHAVDDLEKVLLNGVRALIVDDEPMNLVVASGLFEDYGMDTDTANSGSEAIRKFEEEDYDIIFMDHMMPEMDGVEAMKRIRQVAAKEERSPIIVALTANTVSSAREMFIREGFDGFIAKPIDIREFERTMKQVLPQERIRYERRAAR